MEQHGEEDGVNDNKFNLEMATVNPFFNEESHLPPHLVNNISTDNEEEQHGNEI